jgi:hypothetical protein
MILGVDCGLPLIPLWKWMVKKDINEPVVRIVEHIEVNYSILFDAGVMIGLPGNQQSLLMCYIQWDISSSLCWKAWSIGICFLRIANLEGKYYRGSG